MKNIDNILKLSDYYFEECNSIIKNAVIRKLPNGDYRVLSEKGRNLGTYDSKSEAKKRLQQIEYFKHLDKSHVEDNVEVDLSKIKILSFSAFMRVLRRKAEKEQVRKFLEIYKKIFDNAIENKIKNPADVSLKNTLIEFDKICKIKLHPNLLSVKKSSIEESVKIIKTALFNQITENNF